MPERPQSKDDNPFVDPGTKFSRHTRTLIEAKKGRQAAWIDAYRSGESIRGSSRAAGISDTTYRNWKSTDPEFKAAVREVDRERIAKADAAGDALAASLLDLGTLDKFGEWRQTYLGMSNDEGHDLITDAISKAPAGKITIILAPPEAGKSTTLEDYITFRICLDPNIRITYVHQSDNFVKDVVGRVANRLTDEENFYPLIDRYGPFKADGREWTGHGITVARKTSDERGSTLRGRSIYSRAQGIRTDLLLIDDIQDISTIGQTQRLLNVLRQTFFTRAVKDAPLVMVGNRVDVGDVWEVILDDPGLQEIIEVVTIPAIAGGRSLFPSIKSPEQWATTRRIVGDDVWYRNYMQAPRLKGDGTFRAEDLERALTTNVIAGTRKGIEDFARITSVDPALGGGTCVLTAAWNKRSFAPLDVTWKEGLQRNEQIFAIVAEHFARYEPTHCVFEVATLQRGMARDERFEELARDHGVRVIEHETSRRKMDPVVGVASMASSFIKGEIMIPADTEKPHKPSPLVEPLWDQLLTWRPDIPTRLLRQDAVMAMWFAHLHWRSMRGVDVTSDAWSFTPMPKAAPRLLSGLR